MANGDAWEGKWRGNWRMDWVPSTLHTTSEHGVSSITTADAYILATSSRLNWRPCRFKWTRPFRRKTKCGFCACDVTFQTQYSFVIRQWVASVFAMGAFQVRRNFWQSGAVRRFVGLLASDRVQTESLSTHRESQTQATHEWVFNPWSRCSRDRNGTYLKWERLVS